MTTPRLNGRHRPRLPSNVVYRAVVAAGGFKAVEKALGVSRRTVQRWRRAGRVGDGRAALAWAKLLHADPVEQLRAARRLTGRRRPGGSSSGRVAPAFKRPEAHDGTALDAGRR